MENTSVVYKVTPVCALERERVRAHGDLWAQITRPHNMDVQTRKFLKSVRTGHERWWPVEQLQLHRSS